MGNRIIIIDDDRELVDELAGILKSHGYEVDCAYDGEAGLSKISTATPDLVLLDLRMKGMSGFRVADKLSCSAGASAIPIIAMSGFYTPEEYALILRICGIRRCVTKPFSPDQILKEIFSTLHHSTSTPL